MIHRYETSDGGVIEVTRYGQRVDLHVRNAEGRTVATLITSNLRADQLIRDLRDANDYS